MRKQQKPTNRSVCVLVICLGSLAATSALGQKAKKSTPEKHTFMSSHVRLVINTGQIEGLTPKVSKALFCSGYEQLPLPSIAECPPREGYDTVIGIASCVQTHRIPKVLKFTKQEGGLFALECTLDYSAAEPVGDKTCDYSTCFYTNSPAIWPDTFVDGAGVELGR